MAEQQSIYVVAGEEGIWSDRSEWLVAAYADKTQAEQHADRANQWLEQQRRRMVAASTRAQKEAIRWEPTPYDQQAPYATYGDRDYYVTEVPLRSEPPTAEGKPHGEG